MVVKRALVVDDSRSARAFLIRLLAEQQVEVDAAETAEKAIEYLEKCTPDVIFMDHLMPGMDGFQAVQAIKGNPRTAAIPIMMYTSQEGELYLGQARALGAVGVLPKSVSPADVRMVLQQLQLGDQPAQPIVVPQELRAEEPHEIPTIEMPAADAGAAIHELLKLELAMLRQHLAEALEGQRQHLLGELRSLLREAAPAKPEPAPLRAEPPPMLPIPPEKPRHSPAAWAVALAASIAAAVLGTLWWQDRQQQQVLRAELMDTQSTVALLTARLGPGPQAPGPAQAPVADTLVLQVPFGEAPLSGVRVDALRDFVARIATLAQKGTIEVRRYAGRFCLSGGGAGGYALADGALPSGKCDLVAAANDPQLGSTATESPAFARALAELRKQHAPLLAIDVAAGSGDLPGRAYPDATDAAGASAGEWNAIAADNNRVEIRWHPAT